LISVVKVFTWLNYRLCVSALKLFPKKPRKSSTNSEA